MNVGNDGNLAEQLLGRLHQEEPEEVLNPHPNQWGIDDTGFPWPNPVNAEAVATRVFSKHGKKDGLHNIFRIDDDIFIGRKKLNQTRSTLLALYDMPNIVAWANESTEMQDAEALWEQIKKVISSEYPIVWRLILEMAPEYDREYIRIIDGMVWGKDEADIIYY